MREYGCQSMALPLKRVLMRSPGKSLVDADPAVWNYGAMFNAGRAIEQYSAFAGMVESSGADITWLDDEDDGLADAMFTHDPSLMSDHGAILLQLGKPLRRAETDVHERAYRDMGIPILGRIHGEGHIEGGDCVWLDENTLVVGRGFRSNQAGIEQLAELLAPFDVNVIGFDLPMWKGEAACLHLMSIISPLDKKLALVFAPLLPAPFYQLLRAHGIALIEASADEFEVSNGLSLNVLPLAPRDCIMIDGFPNTRAAMVDAGCSVQTFIGDALCIACEGGPTCLTRPVLRQAA